MPKITRNGKIIFEAPTRAECYVAVFSFNLVFDQHSRRRNQLLPGVKIVGKDYEEEAEEVSIK